MFNDTDDYAPENQSHEVADSLVSQRCHSCGAWRLMPSRATHCRVCLWHQEEGMDIAFRDDSGLV